MPTPKPPKEHADPHGDPRHYTELAQITTGLFVGVLALMTFLLTAGLQHPQRLFSVFVYVALIVLPLNLIAFTIGNSLIHQSRPADAGQWTAVRITRLIQQILFVLGVVAATGLALASAHIFFTPPPAPAPSSSSSQPQQPAQP